MTIIVADDHPMIRASIIDVMQIEHPHTQFVEVSSLSEAEAAIEAHPDIEITLLDLLMPGMNGLAGVQGLLNRHPEVPIAIVSGSLIPDDVSRALEMGVRGYIPKTLKPQHMMDAISGVMNGEIYDPFNAVVEEGGEDIAPESATSTQRRHMNTLFDTLTKRERQVLDGVTKGLSNKEIARENGIQEVTVKVHLKSVFVKLDVTNRTHAVVYALKHGWVSDGDGNKPYTEG